MSRSKVRNVIKDKFLKIERIYAQDGVVKLVDKQGKETTQDIKTALERARALNSMPIPDHHRKATQQLVQKIIEVCREAKAQQVDPFASTTTKMVTNILSGLTAEGKQAPVKTPADMYEAKIFNYKMLYPCLESWEIESVMRDELTDEETNLLLSRVNDSRAEKLLTQNRPPTAG